MNNEFERSTLLTDDYINAKSCGTFSFLLFIFFIKSPNNSPPTHTLRPSFTTSNTSLHLTIIHTSKVWPSVLTWIKLIQDFSHEYIPFALLIRLRHTHTRSCVLVSLDALSPFAFSAFTASLNHRLAYLL